MILGGIHPSVLPEEASQHADAVLVGEAEPLWQVILEDAARDSLQPSLLQSQTGDDSGPSSELPARKEVSDSDGLPDYRHPRLPKRVRILLSSRIYGHRVRKIPVEQVLEQVKRSRSQYVAFLDDNLTADREYALELFTGLRNLKVKFIAQASM